MQFEIISLIDFQFDVIGFCVCRHCFLKHLLRVLVLGKKYTTRNKCKQAHTTLCNDNRAKRKQMQIAINPINMANISIFKECMRDYWLIIVLCVCHVSVFDTFSSITVPLLALSVCVYVYAWMSSIFHISRTNKKTRKKQEKQLIAVHRTNVRLSLCTTTTHTNTGGIVKYLGCYNKLHWTIWNRYHRIAGIYKHIQQKTT